MRRVVVGLLVVVAIAIGVWLWSGHHETVRARSIDHAVASSTGSSSAIDQRARLAWLAQHGVGARRVAGVVLLDGAPIANATVRLASKATRAGLVAEPRLVTDASGHFDFGAQIATTYVVSAESPHVTAAVLALDLRDPTRRTDAIELDLEPCDASIHGTIRDNAGGVVGGARVVRLENGLSTEVGAVADDRGTYEVCVPLGYVALDVKAQGYAEAWDGITVLGRVKSDFSLVPEATVNGRVVRATDQSPIEGALVELQGDRHSVLFASSDADGRFTIVGVMPGAQTITATADHLRLLAPVHVNAAVSSHDDVVVPLRTSLSISGRVTERGTDVGVAGREVRVFPAAMYSRTDTRATTQANGEFTIEGVITGDYTTRIEGGDDPPLHVEAKDLTDVHLEVDQTGSVAGRITFGGKPVEGAFVRVDSKSTTTDHDGRYVLNGLKEGKNAIYSESKRVGAFGSGAEFALASGEHKTGVDLDMPLSASIAGTVVDQNNVPVSNALLRFELARGKDSGTATTAEDGTFLATALSGGGDYVFQVTQNGRYARAFKAEKQRIAVRDGTTHLTGVRIVVRVERLTIAGRVVDAHSKPVSDLRVMALNDYSASAVTDGNGAFEFHDLQAGSYKLSTNAPGGDGPSELVTAGRTDVVLHVDEASGIDGTFEQFTDPFEVVADGERDTGYGTISGNTFRIRDIPVGKYTVSVISPTNTGMAEVVVTAGTIAHVTIRPRAVGTISGTVVDDKQHPIANAYCGASTRDSRTSHVESIADANGAFHFDRVPSGEIHVACSLGDDFGISQIILTESQSATVKITIASIPVPHRGHVGLTLEEHFGEVMVAAVEAGGAAERAGILVGDMIVSVDDRPVYYGTLDSIETRAAATAAKIAIERGDKQLVVSITID